MTFLYRTYGDDGRLLYVGITENNVEQRFSQHLASGAEWLDHLANVVTEWHDDRQTALAAETEAIKSEWPLYNVLGSIGGHGAPAGLRKQLDGESRIRRIRQAVWGYADPTEELNRLMAQLAADEELCARVFADIKAWGAVA
jgi:hypothetical protein